MAITRSTFIRAVLALKLSGLVVLLAIVAMTSWLAVLTRDYAAEVAQARTTRNALIEARSALQDMETGQRGYLLTGRDDYLEPYLEANRTLAERIAHLERIGIGSRAQIDQLKAAVADKTAELSETVDPVKRGEASSALDIVRSDRGKRAMDLARASLSRLLTEVDDRIQNRTHAQDDAITALLWSVSLGAVLIVLVVGGSTLISARYTRELTRARAEIATLNADLERRVERRTADLAQANEEIQRFAYVVSHDLRSPLVNVIGFTRELEEMSEEIFDPGRGAAVGARDLQAEFREATGFISSSVTKMDGLISAILKIARENGRQIVPESVDLGEIARSAAAHVQHRVGELKGSVEVQPGLPTIVSDKLAIEQIVSNLVDNSVKYAHPGRPPRVKITGSESADEVSLTVEDNSRGIAEADQEKVFGLFKRVGSPTAPGEGIGLSHVRSLARRLGGDVSLTSQIGLGSRFTIRLPKTERLPADEADRTDAPRGLAA